MKPKLIIHVGPNKCGSTSIQNFFKKHPNPCEQSLTFHIIDPLEINQISGGKVASNTLLYFKRIVEKHQKKSTIILSHEYLFNKPLAIQCICKILIEHVEAIKIIGFCRNQSSYISSAYSQWFFRSKKRMKEVDDILLKNKINPIMFSGKERFLIGSIFSDFRTARQLSEDLIINWLERYSKIEEFVAPYGVEVICDVLPTMLSKRNLIDEFIIKCELNIKEKFRKFTEIRYNSKYDNNIIEAVCIGKSLNLNLPNSHESNGFFAISKITPKSLELVQNDFLRVLENYIDNHFLIDNNKLAKKYGLSKHYFWVDEGMSKPDITKCIEKVQESRIADGTMIQKYRALSAILVESLYKEAFLNRNKSILLRVKIFASQLINIFRSN